MYVDDDIRAVVKGAKRGVLEVHDAKLDAVEELIGELSGSPLLLAYEFNHDLDRLLHRFGKSTPFIGSGVSPSATSRIEAAWNAGDIPLLLGQPASMGHGLNMQQNKQHVGWFSMFWDLELYTQFLMRVLRQGNKSDRVFNHFFLMRRRNTDEPTVDQLVYYAQKRKQRGVDALSNALKHLVNSRK
jgi:hypothetical protein